MGFFFAFDLILGMGLAFGLYDKLGVISSGMEDFFCWDYKLILGLTL